MRPGKVSGFCGSSPQSGVASQAVRLTGARFEFALPIALLQSWPIRLGFSGVSALNAVDVKAPANSCVCDAHASTTGRRR